jgi:conjugal transfer pilin signal peptidase TrbI
MRVPSLAGWSFVCRSLARHTMKFAWLYVPVVVGFHWTQANYRIGINVSHSLPYRVFVVALRERPTKVGDYVAFEWRRTQYYDPDFLFMKRIAGVGGQTITVTAGDVFIDGTFVAHAKRFSKRGEPLQPIEPGVIPEGRFFALASHPDSLDSRYSVTGLIEQNRIVGKAYVLF